MDLGSRLPLQKYKSTKVLLLPITDTAAILFGYNMSAMEAIHISCYQTLPNALQTLRLPALAKSTIKNNTTSPQAT